MRLPVFQSFEGYQRSWIRSDVLSGLTVVALLVPEGMARQAAVIFGNDLSTW